MLGLGEESRGSPPDCCATCANGSRYRDHRPVSASLPQHLPVERYVKPEEFHEFAREGKTMGFRHVEGGPLVRSSYHAWDQCKAAERASCTSHPHPHYYSLYQRSRNPYPRKALAQRPAMNSRLNGWRPQSRPGGLRRCHVIVGSASPPATNRSNHARDVGSPLGVRAGGRCGGTPSAAVSTARRRPAHQRRQRPARSLGAHRNLGAIQHARLADHCGDEACGHDLESHAA